MALLCLLLRLTVWQDVATARICPDLRESSQQPGDAEGGSAATTRASGAIPSLKELADDLELLAAQVGLLRTPWHAV